MRVELTLINTMMGPSCQAGLGREEAPGGRGAGCECQQG